MLAEIFPASRREFSGFRGGAQDRILPCRPEAALRTRLRRRRRHSYQPRANALGSLPERRSPALKARLILPRLQEPQPQTDEAGRWPAMETRGREPRASALGWYEIGPWPESEGAFSCAQIRKRAGRYIRIYIVPIYSRCSNTLLSRLLKNSVLHPALARTRFRG